MEQIVTMDEDFGIQLPPHILEIFPPGTKISLTVEGSSIRVAKVDTSHTGAPSIGAVPR